MYCAFDSGVNQPREAQAPPLSVQHLHVRALWGGQRKQHAGQYLQQHHVWEFKTCNIFVACVLWHKVKSCRQHLTDTHLIVTSITQQVWSDFGDNQEGEKITIHTAHIQFCVRYYIVTGYVPGCRQCMFERRRSSVAVSNLKERRNDIFLRRCPVRLLCVL